MRVSSPHYPAIAMSRRLPQLLLLALTLLVLALAAQELTPLPAPGAAVLLLAGVLAQGFASYEPPRGDFFEPRRGLTPLLAWLLRASIGCAALAAMLAGAFHLLQRL